MPRPLTGLTRAQEQRRQEMLFMRLAASYDRRFRTEIRRAMTAIAEGALELSEGAAVAEHEERVKRLITSLYTNAGEIFGGRILDAAGKSFNARLERKLVDGTPDFDERMRKWIALNTGMKITQITNTTHEQVMAIVRQIQAQAIIDGVGQSVVAARVRTSLREQGAVISALRARTIARTESHNAASAATHEAASATGIITMKEWASAAGERTRDDHAAADGQRQELNSPFIIGGEELMYPGDPNGSAEQTINCRCCELLMVE